MSISTKLELEQVSELLNVNSADLSESLKSGEITDGLLQSLKATVEAKVWKQEEVQFCNWIRRKWGDCDVLRCKIENEGTHYFYYSYSNVPCSYDMYESFASGSSCWCGDCVNDESEESEEDSEEDLA